MPVLNGDTVIVGGLNAGVAAFAPKLRNGKWIVEPLWSSKAATSYISNPVIVGNTLYGFSRRASGQFFALDAATGRKLWLGPPREATNAAIVKAGEFLFLLKDDAELIVARANPAHLQVVRRYQKVREEWHLGGVTIALDHTPIGDFAEFEGDGAETVAKRCGFDPDKAERRSYLRLYQDHLKKHPDAPPEMVFNK